ncbi:adenosylcobinamide-phosphate synthase CbiB [Caldiplasma sukawensis]
MIPYIQITIFFSGIIIISVFIDLIFGEPRGPFHIAIITGKFSSYIYKKTGKIKNKLLGGKLTVLLTLISVILPVIIFEDVLYSFNFLFIFFVIVYSIFFKSTFALSSMNSHIKPVITHLEAENMEEARKALSLTVRRDLSTADQTLLCSAAIETISESICDGFAGSLFFFALFGPVGSYVYRVGNTLDSIFGYREGSLRLFGRASARFDTYLSSIPARISSLLIRVSSFLLGYNNRKVSIKSLLYPVESRNAAYGMCTMAATLNVRLEKKGSYIVNRKGFYPAVSDIKKALKIYDLSFFLMLIFIVFPIFLVSSLIYWHFLFFILPLKLYFL